MGYLTRYDLEIDDNLPTQKRCTFCNGTGYILSSDLEKIVKSVCKELKYNPFEEPNSWYEHEKTMKLISSIFPNQILRLKGEGQDQGDIWVKEFKDGKMRIAKQETTMGEFGEWK